MKKIAILGSTGSIGQSTLKVISHLKDAFEVTALSANGNIDLLEQQIHQFKPKVVAVGCEEKAHELKKRGVPTEVLFGPDGICDLVVRENVDFVVVAIVGLAALMPTVKAIQSGKNIGLANKEIMVSAGTYIKGLAKKHGVHLIPIDSEHSAVFQCLEGRDPSTIKRVILTASGGPFRNFTEEQLSQITLDQALAHPTWKMGPKITIDSSTLMNKGLELIEAHFLFDIPYDKLDVVIHPQSVVHSLIEFIDGSVLAQMSDPLMIYPIQYALTYPNRRESMLPPFDFIKNKCLEFYPPDHKKFPALKYALFSLEKGGSLPCYLNAANEVLVDRFLKKEITWQGIASRLQSLIMNHQISRVASLENIVEIDHKARMEAIVS